MDCSQVKTIETNILDTYEQVTKLLDRNLNLAKAFDKDLHNWPNCKLTAGGINQELAYSLIDFLVGRS